MITKKDFTRANSDINGNPRYVIHFLQCCPGSWQEDIGTRYAKTIKLMNKIGGRKFHNKQYGGGIVFQSYNLDETIKAIETIKKGAHIMITNIGTCLPDYFRGHHKTVLQVPVWLEITKEELTESIISEYNMCWDHFVEYGDWPDMTDDELRKACNELILTDEPFKDSPIPSLEEQRDGDFWDYVHTFFIWEEENDE
jgi:hypothetical protein